MKHTPLRQISKKQAVELRKLKVLVADLKERANYCSEYNGEQDYLIEPHHIKGRIGKDLLDPFNIILLTPVQHRRAQGGINQLASPSKEELLEIVRTIRISQGFTEAL